jgi:hypothetical protein
MAAPERRIANVRKLIRLAGRFERDEGGDLRGFLAYAAHAERELGRMEPHAPVADEELEAVRLMTVHAAKGLEFPVVCVPELGARPNLRVPDLLVAGERMGVRLLRPGAPEATPALQFEELSAERRSAQEQEEDRILYVALTRARERLLLSGALSFKRWPCAKPGSAPIGWLAPALVPGIERRVEGVVRGDSGDCDPVWVADGPAGRVRCWLNAPPTLGRVLREGPLRPLARTLDAADGPRSYGDDQRGRPRGVEVRRASPRERVPAPEAAVLPGALSYTALALLEGCAYRYYLEEVLRLPETRDRGLGGRPDAGGARARGRIMHRLMESFDFADEAPVSPAHIRVLASELGAPWGPAECEEAASLLAGLRGTELGARLSAAGVLREQPFAFALDAAQPLVTGVVDALLRDRAGRYLVIDYKSDRVRADDDLDELVRRDYGLQRLLYALAALRDGACEVEVVHWFLHRPQQPVRAGFCAAQAPALEADLRRRMRAAAARGYVVAERPSSALCAGCPGRGTLCSWKYEQTLAPRP